MRRAVGPALAAAVALGGSTARAQEFAVPLAEARREMGRDERLRAWTLLGEGMVSTAVGVPMIALSDDPAVQWAGVMTAAFGAVNLGLAIPWVLRVTPEERDAAGGTELAVRLRRSRAARRTAAVFALNVGLDVLYVAAGATAWALGAERDDRGLRGAGIASLAQGVFLLGFDVWGWIASDANAERFVR